jgi:dihydrodipicolinate synthase/N-acetylneuraminate lyase
MNRRTFLSCLTLGGAAVATAAKTDPAAFRGIYPIMQTPYLDAGGVDFATLAAETKWLERTGVHGIVWPQLASEYSQLSRDERMEGMATIVRANKGLPAKCVLGVQADSTDEAVAYAKHADKLRPDAIIAIPPRKPDGGFLPAGDMREYYKAIGRSTDLPLFVQAIGDLSVEFILEMTREIPTLHFVKDEAGHTLYRITEFAEAKGARKPAIFTGGHGKTLIDEMARGAAGNMPAVGAVDLYVDCWEAWQAGRHGAAQDAFARLSLMVAHFTSYGLESLNYLLKLRGVFPNSKIRTPQKDKMDREAYTAMERTYAYLKPYLRA